MSLPIEPKTKTIEVKKIYDQKYLYLIDSGHGYSESAKCGTNSSDIDGECFWEWEYCWEITNILCRELDRLGIYYIRVNPHANESNMHPRNRIKYINQIRTQTDSKIFLLSIHANSSKNRNASGFEIFLKDNKFAKDSTQREVANLLAKNYRQLIPTIPIRSKNGIDYKNSTATRVGEVGILKQTKGVYAILTENGFFTNPDEVEQMKTNLFKTKIAMVHLNTIIAIEQN